MFHRDYEFVVKYACPVMVVEEKQAVNTPATPMNAPAPPPRRPCCQPDEQSCAVRSVGTDIWINSKICLLSVSKK